MNKIVPENPPPYSRPFLKTDESEIEVPRINLDTIEGKPNENIILESYSSVKFPSNNNSCYVDPINLEATTNIVKKNLKPQEKTFKDKIKEIEFIKIKKDTPEEKDSPLNEILDSNSLISPVLNQNDVTGSPILKKGSSIAKRRIMPLDSQIFQKKTLSPGISTQIPIDKLSLMIDKENERYVSQIFDFRFESDKNWLGVTIANEFLSSQEIIDIKIYSSNDEMPYKWELKDHYKHEENSCLFGKVFEALDLNTSKKYSMKLIDYEILDLVVLHDLLYNLLICRYFTYLGDYEHILKVHDIYITESNNIFEGVKHHIMVVILENAPMSLSHLIDIRKQKQLKWKDEELLLYMKNFLEELQKIYVNTGWCCEIKPENIFYSLTSNSLKLCNFRKRSTFTHLESEEVNWAIQIKTLYSTIQAMKTLNTTISMSNRKTNSKLPEIDNHITKEESIGKNNAITILADLLLNRPEDYKVVEGKIKNLGNFTEALKKNNEHLIYEIYYVHEKKDNTENMIKNFSFFSKKYESLLQFTQAFECYEKVIKYRQNDLQTNEKSFLKIKYYMGYIFFQTGYFEEAADKLKEVMEVLGSKYPDEFHLNVDIEIIFGMIEKQKKDIDSSIKHFESALQLLRKNGLLSNLKTSQILVYLGYLYDVFGLNLSQIKKAHRYYTEALNIRKAILKNKYQNNLVIN